MITQDDFRRLALSMPDAAESAHMGHPDFRVGKRIFATLDYPEPGFAMVKLTVEQRELVMEDAPAAFAPVPGGWGKDGATTVTLEHADEASAESAIRMAWENLERRSLSRR
jgi:hypothetical protein